LSKFLAALFAAILMFVVAPSALAAPGDDDGIASQNGFRLNESRLEPGCFPAGQLASQHIDLSGFPNLTGELHITVGATSIYSVDQVLVAGSNGGYRVYNTFDTGVVNNDADIDPNQTGVDMLPPAGSAFVNTSRTIVCVSDHGPLQNEPYGQEADGRVSAINRPIIRPVISALGASSISNLHTYKLGWGYVVEQWYKQPAFDGAHAFLWSVIDSNAGGSVFTPFNFLPDTIRINPREEGPFDAGRINDVDSFAEEFNGPQADYGQVRTFRRAGDLTAWTESGNNVPDTLGHLITFTAEGDLPYTWTLKPSLAGPGAKRSVTLDADYLAAWKASWQSYCDYKTASRPALPLAPGTSAPCQRGSEPVVTAPPLPPVVNPTPVTVNPTPVTVNPPANTAPVTVGGVTPGGGNAISNAVANAGRCTSTRVIRFSWPKSSKAGSIRFRNKTMKARMNNGRLRATADMRGYSATHGDVFKITQITRTRTGRVVVITRVFKAC
jgi:hypothetical protein